MAAEYANLAINSVKVSGAELGRGYAILGLASQGRGNFIHAQIAFEHSLRILEHDREHVEDYTPAFDTYAGLYLQLGQFDVGVPMCRKPLRLRNVVASRLVGARVGAAIGHGDFVQICSRTKGQTAGVTAALVFRRGLAVGPSFPAPKRYIVPRAEQPITSPTRRKTEL
jgi:hypothetical protein